MEEDKTLNNKEEKQNPIWRIIGYSFLLLLILFLIILQLPAFQTHIAKKITNNLSEKLDAKIEFSEFELSFFNGLKINNLYIEDQAKDTLIFVEELHLKSIDLRTDFERIQLGELFLKNGYYNLHNLDTSKSNMQFLIDYFSSDKKGGKKTDFILEAKHLNFDNIRFKYKTHDTKPSEIFNHKDSYVQDFNLDAYKILVHNDSIQAEIENISLKEKSGIEIKQLKADAIISSSLIELKELSLITNKSNLKAKQFVMSTENWSSYNQFYKKVKLDVDMELSEVHSDDIAYFSSTLKDIKLPISVQGEAKGPISKLKSKHFFMSFGDHSLIHTKFSSLGLPNTENAFITLEIKKMHLDSDDLEHYIASINSSENYKLPKTLHNIKEINYKGNITGFLSDLVAYGTFKNNQGIVKTDMRFKRNSKTNELLFSGKLNTHELSLASLNSNDTIFKKVSLQSELNLKILKNRKMQGNIIAEISNIDIKNYRYQNISINAKLDNELLESYVSVTDTNLNLNVQSAIDFSQENIHYIINSNVRKAKLGKLNLFHQDTDFNLSFNIKGNFSNISPKKFNGYVNIDSLKCTEGSQLAFIDSFYLKSTIKDNIRDVKINSDIADMQINGQFNTKDLNIHFKRIYNRLIPALYQEENKKIENIEDQYFDLDLTLRKTNLLNIIYPKLGLAEQSKLMINYQSTLGQFNTHFSSDAFNWSDITAKKISLNISDTSKGLFTDLSASKLHISDDLNFHDININNHIYSDTINSQIKWGKDKDNNTLSKIDFTSIFLLSKTDSLNLNIAFDPSYMYIQDSIWRLNEPQIHIRNSQIDVNSMQLSHNNQYIYVDGKIGDKEQDSLHIKINNIDLNNFPIINKKAGLNIGGIVNSNLTFGKHKNDKWLSGYVKIDTARIHNDLIGNIKLDTQWEPKVGTIKLKLINTFGPKSLETLRAKGLINLKKKDMGFELEMNRQKAAIIEPFVYQYLSNIRGYVSGKMFLNGWGKDLKYNGNLKFQKASFIVDYLKTQYNFTHDVNFDEKSIEISNLEVFESNGRGNKATVNGSIKHHQFNDMKFDIDMQLDNFLALNTTLADNNLFYGTAFATGVINLRGTPKNTVLNISAKTERKTEFAIPISENNEASGSEFITFKSPETKTESNKKEENYKVDLSGFEINMDLDIQPDAKVELIFNQKLGDILRASGRGNLNLTIDALGTFEISGKYTINKGDYLFTLQNVINKKFKIDKGSSIVWNGNPLDAYLNINAVYRLKTPLYDLTLDPEDKKRIPVSCYLKMEESLMAPEIDFDIKLPSSSNDKAKGLLSSLDTDEKNKQILSLLILRRFHTPDYLRGGEQVGSGNAVGKHVSEILSNQFSNWFSGVSDDFDIGINYRPGDEISNNELEVALSTQLFNDRVIIDGNVGMGEYESTTSNFVGSVNVDVKLNKKGNIRVRGFNIANDNQLEYNSLYTQGVGLYFREDFDSFGKLLKEYWAILFDNQKKRTKNKQ